ncbi:MAG: hypothetical protein WC788_09175 [Candidatus Paceibacterota bacterium]|jgi:hypothetical protein
MPKCEKCNGTGTIDTGNNELPCDCEAGITAMFSIAEVDGSVTGKEVKLFFLNDSPFKMKLGKDRIPASSLPTRRASN